MGTELLRSFPDRRASLARLTLEAPNVVRAVHTAYFQAGAQALTTNTFLAAQEPDGPALADAAVRLAARAASAKTLPPVLLSCCGGSCAERIVPFAEAGQWAGAKVLLLETVTRVADAVAVLQAFRRSRLNLPVIVSCAFDARGRTLSDRVPAGEAARSLIDGGADAIGANCEDPERIDPALEEIASVLPQNFPLFVRPSAGMPERRGEGFLYPWSAEPWADAVVRLRMKYGPNRTVLGGCCGAGPAHIAALAARLRPKPPFS